MPRLFSEMFIDEIKVFARAGHGGKGCVSFLREAFRPKGGPAGGNGGQGGDVILEADHDLNNLIGQYYIPRLIAENGENGMGKGMDGHAGKHKIVKVPCGTLVWQLPTPIANTLGGEGSTKDQTSAKGILTTAGSHRPLLRTSSGGRALEFNLEEEEVPTIVKPDQKNKGLMVADLTTHGQRFILCKGGRGGLGNRNFATAARQTPRFAQPGDPGLEGSFLLELRIMADVGLVGYPNAGKSTLLAAISHARPKIAAYPFTTLTPQIGIVYYNDYARLTLCDVPGLIEGAHQNVGLGHAFLRHIERCKVIVILLDMAGTDARFPWDDYKQLLKELEWYDPQLLMKPRLVVANKMDESAGGENLKKFKRKISKTPVLSISAAFDQGLEPFKLAIKAAAEKAPPLV